MIAIMIVPTGIGAKIDGHSGDATAAAKLLAACCDTLIGHPNIFNAADINEIPENCLYVEGSMLDRFLIGAIDLRLVKQNKILLVVNKPLNIDTQNSVNAARIILGADIQILVLETELTMEVRFNSDGSASGEVGGWRELLDQVREHEFDALAIQTKIECDRNIEKQYAIHGGVNPWGGVEAKVSKLVSRLLHKPVAHAPVEFDNIKYLVDPRMAAEYVSISYLHCILKGLHKAPRMGEGISVRDVDVMISPYGCFGEPHYLCRFQNIPIIAVRENKTIFNREYKDFIYVDNYLEAAGHLMCMQAGILPKYVRYPR